MSGMGGTSVGSGYVDVEPRFNNFKEKLNREVEGAANQARQRIDKTIDFGDKFTKRVSMPIAAGLGFAIKAASDLNEAANVAGLVFGDAAGEIEAFAKTASTSIGQSERATLEATGAIGGLLDNLGFAQDETVSWSKDLTVLAADMASAFNTDPADAVAALGSGLRGETEPLRRFNVMLDDASVRAKAVEMGLAASAAEVDKHGKAQASLALIMEQTSTIQGDFANTAEGVANASRTAKAQLEDTAAALGETLLPMAVKALGGLNDLIAGFNNLPGPMKETITWTAAAAAALGPLLSVGGRTARMFTDLRGGAGGAASSLQRLGLAATGAMAAAAAADALGTSLHRALHGAPAEVDALTLAFQGLASQEAIPDSVAGSLDGMGAALERVAGPHLTDKLWGPLSGPEGDKAKENVENVDAALASLVMSGNQEAAARGFEELTAMAADAGVDVDRLRELLPGYAKALDAAALSSDNAADSTEILSGGLEKTADRANAARQAMKDHADELRAQIDPVFALTRALDGVEDAQEKYTDAVEEYGSSSDEARRAAEDKARALLDVEAAAVEGEMSFAAFEEKLATWVKQGQLTEQQAANIRDRVAEARGEAEKISRRYETELALSGASGARAQLAEFRRELERIPERIRVNVAASSGGIGPGGYERRHGGSVSAGELYTVGHGLGDEAFVPGVDGYMLAAAETSASVERGVAQALARAGGSSGGLSAEDRRLLRDLADRPVIVEVDGEALAQVNREQQVRYNARNGR